jgi:hypothetical protein
MIKEVIDNKRLLKNKRLFFFIIVSVITALLSLFISYKLAPWFYAINTRVRLYLTGSAETKIDICWDTQQIQCMPLVPYSNANNKIAQSGEIADLWMGELPPRPKYDISLVFSSSFQDIIFNELDLDSSNILIFGYSQNAGVRNLQFSLDQFKLQGVENQLFNDGNLIEGAVGSQIHLNKEIIPGPPKISPNWSTTISIWGLILSFYLLIAIPLFLLPNIVINLDTAIKKAYRGKYPWWVFMFGGGAIVILSLLVLNSGVIFMEYDPLGYLYLAVGGGYFNDARLPGYPVFLGITLRLFNYNLNNVITIQAILLGISILVCVWTLRKWIQPYLAVLFILLCLFSPAQVHWARWILRESIFASLIILGITAVIAHFTSEKPYSEIWLLIFTAICGISFLVRENGIILPAALLPVLIPKAIKGFLTTDTLTKKVKSVALLGLHYLGPIFVIGIIYIGFSFYNYKHYGYFQVGLHQTSHSLLVKTIYTANSDARSLIDPENNVSFEAKSYHGWLLYDSYILTRDQSPGLDPIYAALYPTVSQIMSERGEPINSFHIASILNEIGKGIDNRVSWEANIAGLLRQYREVVSLHNTNNIYPLLIVDPSRVPYLQSLLDQLPAKTHIRLEEKVVSSDNIIYKYYNVTKEYKWYGILLILALFSCIYILKYCDPVFVTPMAFFIANSIMLLTTRLVSYRYLVSLDVVLILQTILGFSLWIRRKNNERYIPSFL